MKIGIISDLHSLHNRWYRFQNESDPELLKDFLNSDIIIFAGDMTNIGTYAETQEFFYWISCLPTSAKIIMIAGNHDYFLEAEKLNRMTGMTYSEEFIQEFLKEFPDIIYLNNSEYIYNGIKIWGSPYSLPFYNWAFMATEKESEDIYSMIPEDTDIVITHGPCYDILDMENNGSNTGSITLRNRIEIIKPKLHICGHIHEEYGIKKIGETTYINGSSLDRRYMPVNPPIIVEI